MREHPRRRLMGRRPAVVRHAPAAESVNVAADLDALPAAPVVCSCHDVALCPGPAPAVVSRETVGGPYVAGGQVPPLSRERITRLEALTAQWVRDVRVGGPGPDDTMLAPPSLSRPPVPTSRRPAPVEASLELTEEEKSAAREMVWSAPVVFSAPVRVSDWTSRHDPRSLDFAVRDRLSRPVPLQDFVLEHGPILDQGTTPPLSVHDASACVGMAVVAAVNALGGIGGLPGDVEDARAIYVRAQHLDSLSGEAYAGTSVLAGMKAGQEAGYWNTYLWALGGTRDVAQVLLQLRSPVVVGVPWSEKLENPDADGVITPGGADAGGHALAVVGLRLSVAGRPGPWFVLQQSRGVAEGNGGLVYLHHTHLAGLLAGRGEAAVPLSRWATP